MGGVFTQKQEFDLSQLVKQHRAGFINGVGSTDTHAEEEHDSRERRKTLTSLVAQAIQAEAMREFNAAMDEGLKGIKDAMGDFPKRFEDWKFGNPETGQKGFIDRQIERIDQQTQGLEKVIAASEAALDAPTNANIDAARLAIDDQIRSDETMLESVEVELTQIDSMEQEYKGRALKSLEVMKTIAEKLPDPESKEHALAHLNNVKEFLESDGAVQIDKSHLEALEKRTQAPDLADSFANANDEFLKIRKDVVDKVHDIKSIKSEIEAERQGLKDEIAQLRELDGMYRNLKAIPEEKREEFLKQYPEKRQEILDNISQHKTTLHEKLDKRETLETQRLEELIKRQNEIFQRDEGTSYKSKAMDKLSDAWEQAKGFVWNDSELRYRYQGHRVIMAAETKLYYYMDENGHRVLLPAETQQEFRKLDKADSLSQVSEKINEAASASLRGAFGKAGTAVKDGAKSALETAENGIESVGHAIANTANSAAESISQYWDNLRIFSPREDTTPPVSSAFSGASGTAVNSEQPVAGLKEELKPQPAISP
jgi:hypothetical protein